jgi:hypothetical protein
MLGLIANLYISVFLQCSVADPPINVTLEFSLGANGELEAGAVLNASCKASGAHPPASIHWLRNNEVVGNSANISIVTQGGEDHQPSLSLLTITTHTQDHGSEFLCVASHMGLMENLTAGPMVLNIKGTYGLIVNMLIAIMMEKIRVATTRPVDCVTAVRKN